MPSLDLSGPEIHILPKLVQAADMGVSSSDLGFAVNAMVDGAYGGDYYLDGKKIDLTIKGEDRYASSTQDIQCFPSPRRWVSWCRWVPWRPSTSAVGRNRSTTVSGCDRSRSKSRHRSPYRWKTRWIGSIRRLSSRCASGQLEGGYHIALAGTADKLRETWRALRFNILLAGLITYLLMAALFESWLYPFVIILSVPLGAMGGILGLQLLNVYMKLTSAHYVPQSLDVLTMLGFVILIGTVVNNPILIVHQSLNHMREDGMSPRDAILESVRTRIRPIFMTTITTVLGLLPLVLFPGAGSELYRGLGSVVLGGLLISTLFTLVLVPTLFSLTMGAKTSLVRLFWPAPVAVPSSEPQVARGRTRCTPADVPGRRTSCAAAGLPAEPRRAGQC